MTPTRPALRWHGGKWKLAPWVIEHFPPHRTYVEPFGGAASVLLRKPRVYAEVYNDLDDEVVTLFRVLRDPGQASRLLELLRVTPFARVEFKDAYEHTDDPVERARRLCVRSFMGFGSNAYASDARGHRATGFRCNTTRSGSTPARDWEGYPDALAKLVARLRGVVIEHRPAAEVVRQHDGRDTLHYLDPPYMHALRAPSNKYDLKFRMYRHEMTDEQHAELLDLAKSLAGMVVLSGYSSPLYEGELATWHRVERKTFADGARARREVLWINPHAHSRMFERQDNLPMEAV